MLRLALPFMVGIGLARSFPPDVPLWLGLTGLFAVACACGYLWVRSLDERWIPGLLLILFAFSFGHVWQGLHAQGRSSVNVLPAGNMMHGAVIVEDVYRSGSTVSRAMVKVFAVYQDSIWRPTSTKAFITLRSDSIPVAPAEGDRLLLHCRFEAIRGVANPGSFDRVAWAERIGVTHDAFVAAGNWVTIDHQPQFADHSKLARDRVIAYMKDLDLGTREESLARALLLGDRTALDRDQQAQFRESGTVHVLAVSGLHVGLIYIALLWVFGRIGTTGWRKVLNLSLTITGLWVYAWLTGGSPSVMRAALMFTLFAMASAIARQTYHLNSLAAAAFILLLFDPDAIVHLGFQLSFLAVLGIILFYRPIYGLLPIRSKALDKVWALATVSIAAQLMTGPHAMQAFGAFPVWFLPANIIVVFLVTIIVNLGAIALILLPIPVLCDILGTLLHGVLVVLDRCTAFFASLPGAYLPVRIDLLQELLLYGMIAILAYSVLTTRKLVTAMNICVVAFLVAWGIQAHRVSRHRQLTMYHGYSGSLMSVQHGRKLHVFTESIDQRSKATINAHQSASGIDEIIWYALPSREERTIDAVAVIDPGGTVGPQFRVVHGSGTLADIPELRPTEVLLQGDVRFDLDQLKALNNADPSFILMPDVPGRSRYFLIKWFAEQGISLHDVRKDGAYIRKL